MNDPLRMKKTFYTLSKIFAGLLLGCWGFSTFAENTLETQLAALEAASGGRMGVYALNTGNQQNIQYRADEHFPIQSTFKILLVSAILKKSMTDPQLLQKKIYFSKNAVVAWSPVTEKHIAEGMTIYELCRAAMTYTDNTAANLLMKELGGPNALTDFARTIGDKTFQIESWEAELNSNPNDLRDSSTPAAMEKSLQKLTFGNILTPPLRKQLISWMKNNTTGDTRIRAGAPKGWQVADKTGSGSYGITNDIGIIWPPSCPPIIVALYFNRPKHDDSRRDDVLAAATRILSKELVNKTNC